MIKRTSGVLMHITSLPSKYGVGTFGKEAYEFVDFLNEAKFGIWQILPLNLTSYGDSPYQSPSNYGYSYYLIDLDTLVEKGLLTKEDLEGVYFGENPRRVNFEALFNNKIPLLKKAFANYKKEEAFTRFLNNNPNISDFAIFMTLKELNNFKSWKEWPKKYAEYTQEQVDYIFRRVALKLSSLRIPLAKMAVEETGMGVVEDKVIKNHFASEYIYNKFKNTKTCGILEEDKANGAPVDDAAIQGVKVGMMGPLAGVGDPVFWYTVRPILGALGASLAMGGSILGPILFFVLWNVIRWAFMWYTQEFGYRVGTKITEDLSGGLLQKVTKGASILGMFVLGALIERWVSINFTPVVSTVQLSDGAYIDWSSLPSGAEGIQTALQQYASGLSLTPEKVTTLQDNLNSLIPGFVPLLLTLLCMWLLKKNVSPIIIIIALFIVGIAGHVVGLL